MASTETPTATQTAALQWVHTREGKRPSTTALQLLVARGWSTASTKDAELTPEGRAALGLPVLGLDDPRVTQDPEEQAVLVAAAAALDALPTDDAPEALPVVPAQDPELATAEAANATVDAVELTPFNGADGQPIRVGSRVTVAAKGNNVRAKDVGQVGTVTGWSRTRVKVSWDATEDAPWKAILPALVTVQS